MFIKDFTKGATPASFLRVLPATAPTGLSATTLIEGASGWQTADTLRIGARVHTFDGGLVTILGLARNPVRDTPAILIPGGIAGNCADLTLARGQHILVDTLDDPGLPDAEMVLVPATAFLGLPGVIETRLSEELITLMFAHEEILWANSGTLVHCPSLAGTDLEDGFFQRLSAAHAQSFIARRWARLG